ncbi:MAG: hypothetical protein WCA46_13555 [Actinocatenispora sp.]
MLTILLNRLSPKPRYVGKHRAGVPVTGASVTGAPTSPATERPDN